MGRASFCREGVSVEPHESSRQADTSTSARLGRDNCGAKKERCSRGASFFSHQCSNPLASVREPQSPYKHRQTDALILSKRSERNSFKIQDGFVGNRCVAGRAQECKVLRASRYDDDDQHVDLHKTIDRSITENNPEVMTGLMHKLGLSKSLEFHDVYSIDEPELLAFVPRPVHALLLVFPVSKTYEKFRTEEDAPKSDYAGKGASEPVVWYKQTIRNACGLIGLLHAVSNGGARKQVGAYA